MFRRYINLFLTLLMPLSILSVVIASITFTFKFELFEAIRLGILAGIAAGVGLSILLAFIVMIKRRVEAITTQPLEESLPSQETALNGTSLGKQNNSFILFMDKALAFETAIYTLTKNLIGEITNTDQKYGIIEIKDEENDKFRLKINPLTTHSTIVKIESTEASQTLENIFYALKGVDRSFMRY